MKTPPAFSICRAEPRRRGRRASGAPARTRSPARCRPRRRAPGPRRRAGERLADDAGAEPPPRSSARPRPLRSITSREVQNRSGCASGSCSAWAIRSAARTVGLAESSATSRRLGRPGQPSIATRAVDLLLGERDEDVAGAEDLVDRGRSTRCRTPARRSPGRRRRGRRVSTPATFAAASRIAAISPSAPRWRGQDDLADAGHARWDDRHQQRRGVRRAAARRVHADARSGRMICPSAVAVVGDPAIAAGALVELRIWSAATSRPARLGRDGRYGRVELGRARPPGCRRVARRSPRCSGGSPCRPPRGRRR